MAGPSERAGASGSWAYRAGVAVALVTSFLTAWTTIVRDDDTGIGFFLLIMAAAVGAFSAWFQPAGMARAMLGVAIMQVLLGIAIATAPLTAATVLTPFRFDLERAVAGRFTADAAPNRDATYSVPSVGRVKAQPPPP